jgi:tetratricopeptide (TPR) repeat protein
MKTLHLFLLAGIPMFVTVPALAQGMSEAGGVYSIPKPLPSADTLEGGLLKMYGTQQYDKRPIGEYETDEQHLKESARIAAAAGQQSNHLFQQAQQKEKEGKLKEALDLYFKSLGVRQSVWGDKDQACAKIYLIIGDLYRKQNRLSDAEFCFRRSQSIVASKGGADESVTIDSYKDLADVLTVEKKWTDAQPMYKEALLLMEKKVGSDHPDCIDIRLKLAKLDADLGAFDEAEPLVKRSVVYLDNSGDNRSPQFLNALDLYAQVLKAQNENEEAGRYAKQAEALRTELAKSQKPAEVKAESTTSQPAPSVKSGTTAKTVPAKPKTTPQSSP